MVLKILRRWLCRRICNCACSHMPSWDEFIGEMEAPLGTWYQTSKETLIKK